MNKKAWLFTLVASLGAGAVLAQNTNVAVPASPSPTPEVPAISTPAPAATPAPVVTNAAPAEPAAEAVQAKPAKKKIVKKPAAKIVPTGLPASHVLLDPPAPATVKVDALNMRGLPSLSGEVVTKLHKGESVTVLEEITLDKARQGEPAKWARVSLPTNTPVWVSAHLVDPATKTVIPRKLNVRGGPGENFNVLARLEKGTVVKEIRKNQEWLEIETPAQASAFVAADFLEKQSSSPAPAIPVISAPEPTIAATPESAVPAAAPEVVTVQPDTNNVVMPAVDAATPAPVVPEPAPIVAESAPAVVTPLPPTTNTDEILPKRIVTREGVISKAHNIQAPAYYELHDATSGELLDYLNPSKPEVDLQPYIGKKTIVSGEEAMDRRWKFTPVIQVETVELP